MDCDHRFRLPNPSPTGFSDVSSVLLLLLRVFSGPRRKAISDASLGPCEPIGSTELRALSPGELSDPARLIVVATEPEADFGREDWRLDDVLLAGLPVAETEALLPCIMLSGPEADVQPSSTTRLFCSPTTEAPEHVARTLFSCASGGDIGAAGLIREMFCYTEQSGWWGIGGSSQ